jgi:hypothetical protein
MSDSPELSRLEANICGKSVYLDGIVYLLARPAVGAALRVLDPGGARKGCVTSCGRQEKRRYQGVQCDIVVLHPCIESVVLESV